MVIAWISLVAWTTVASTVAWTPVNSLASLMAATFAMAEEAA